MGKPFLAVAMIAAMSVSGVCIAEADHAPAFVVPGRPGLPVVINGYDAAWGVVEGDWGLYRPGAVAPTVIPAPHADPDGYQSRYFPSADRPARVGRHEINPPANRRLPPAAEPYRRSWFSDSDPAPATESAPGEPLIVAPTIEPRLGPRRR